MEDDWTVSANDALTISLVRPGPDSKLQTIASFNPKFTYPIFGDDEQIFGYKGLKINLKYDARDLRPNLSVSFATKFSAIGDVEALDVKEKLKEFLPGVAFQSNNQYEQAVKSLHKNWVPPGEHLKSVTKHGERFEVWHGTLSNPAVKQFLQRVQITALFYIEGATYAGQDADGNVEPDYSLARWSVFFVYKVTRKGEFAEPEYTFQGYSTVYNFWVFDAPTLQGDLQKLLSGESEAVDTSPYGSSHRMRISQFLILPHGQSKGIGALLYNTIFGLGALMGLTKEITVEDPNEDFDLLRDLCDLKFLYKNSPDFVNLRINTAVLVPMKGGLLLHDTRIEPTPDCSQNVLAADGILDVAMLERLRVRAKIAPRQFWRLVEMQLMSKLPDSVRPQMDEDARKPKAQEADEHAYMLWRLVLKQRVYRRNVSQLGEFSITERIIKLNETLGNIEFEYAAILDRFNSKSPAAENVEATNDNANGNTNGKRKLGSGGHEAMPPNKKARV
ncbi:acyl-CoA N-acyltransferase [Hypoxylon sp. FL1284]|nr:acyl-CoA N-acyltransferase [Hypoxylon sp. FL1284]